MHVLHVIDGLGLGGAERMLVDIANATVTDGHRVSVCVTRKTTTLASELDPSIDVLVLGRERRIELGAYLRFTQWVRDRNVDLIHAHMRSSTAFVLPLRAVRALKAPLLFHDHYGTIEVDTSVPRWFKLGSRFVAMYVGVYEKLADWARGNGMSASRVCTIPNALDLQRLAPKHRVDLRGDLRMGRDQLLGILVATLRRDKGIEVVLEAISRLPARDSFKLVIVGHDGEPAYADSCRARCRELGLENTVVFLGPRTDVPALLSAADFAVLSSHTESGPLVLVEYIAASLPFVSTLVGDIGRAMHALGVPGFVAPGDPQALATGLAELLELDRTERHERGARGNVLLRQHWDLNTVMPRWYSAYERALTLGRRP